MEHAKNQKVGELQRDIDEQEISMSALLVRVMERPLAPFHETIKELRSQISAAQDASVHAATSIEAGLREALEDLSKRLNGCVSDVADNVDTLTNELSALASTLEKRHRSQLERDEQVHQWLAQACEMLARIDAKANTAANTLDAAVRGLGHVGEAIVAAREAQSTFAERVSKELVGLGEHLGHQHAQLDGKLGGTTTVLERIDGRAAAAGERLVASALVVAKIDANLSTLREHAQASTDELSRGVNTLATSVDKTARDIAARYESLSETQKAMVVAAVQEQLAIQLSPLQTRTRWLAAICGLSLASTLALLCMQLIRS